MIDLFFCFLDFQTCDQTVHHWEETKVAKLVSHKRHVVCFWKWSQNKLTWSLFLFHGDTTPLLTFCLCAEQRIRSSNQRKRVNSHTRAVLAKQRRCLRGKISPQILQMRNVKGLQLKNISDTVCKFISITSNLVMKEKTTIAYQHLLHGGLQKIKICNCTN